MGEEILDQMRRAAEIVGHLAVGVETLGLPLGRTRVRRGDLLDVIGDLRRALAGIRERFGDVEALRRPRPILVGVVNVIGRRQWPARPGIGGGAAAVGLQSAPGIARGEDCFA
jgi:hypothetical protein